MVPCCLSGIVIVRSLAAQDAIVIIWDIQEDFLDADGLGAVGGYRHLQDYTRLGGVLTVFSL